MKTATIGNLTNGSSSSTGRPRHPAAPAAADDDEPDPMMFRPNPSALRGKTDGDNEGDEDGGRWGGDGNESKSSAPYRPPRMEAVYYHEDDRSAEKEKVRREKLLKKASSSSIMQSLREEFSEKPAEARGNFHGIMRSTSERGQVGGEGDPIIDRVTPSCDS